MATSIKELIQQMTKIYQPTIVIGVVTQTEPLRITLKNEMGINLPMEALSIPSRLKPLSVGDSFFMLPYDSGNQYYLLDRE